MIGLIGIQSALLEGWSDHIISIVIPVSECAAVNVPSNSVTNIVVLLNLKYGHLSDVGVCVCMWVFLSFCCKLYLTNTWPRSWNIGSSCSGLSSLNKTKTIMWFTHLQNSSVMIYL